MSSEKRLMFDSYNAMSRPAMYWGIPIMPLVGLFMAALLFGVLTAIVFSLAWGLLVATPFLSMLVALRLICEKDNNYLRRIRFGLRRLWLNFKHGKNLLLTPYNPNWSKFYGKRFSQQRYAPGENGSSDEVSRRTGNGDAGR